MVNPTSYHTWSLSASPYPNQISQQPLQLGVGKSQFPHPSGRTQQRATTEGGGKMTQRLGEDEKVQGQTEAGQM